MNKLFYFRTSTVNQSVSRQLENMKKIEGFDPNNLFIDKIQGNIPFMERPQAALLFDVVTNFYHNKDVEIYVDSIDRLGRNTVDILRTIELFTSNKVNLVFLKESFSTLLDNGNENPSAKLVLSVMASIAEMERNRIKERVAEGVQIAKANGKYKGRKPGSVQTDDKLLNRHQDVVNKLQRNWSVRAISKTTGKSFQTISKVRKVLLKRKGLNS